MSWWAVAIGFIGNIALVYCSIRFLVIPRLTARVRAIAQYEIAIDRRLQP